MTVFVLSEIKQVGGRGSLGAHFGQFSVSQNQPNKASASTVKMQGWN